eukprot:CAMPEP_0183509086 /NCGR_PEP_ID=MMETSP0371-20130417/9346_1 /TAXON_ID=268820 /ORGANISM="Peridinium aciculiferum, Strain PAER-2" /LENGTH=312 /DNA_ID=CAMNT_0025705613 /DNA_START=46 /DNA_END=984 /DNA_ORIENTATION=+
MAAAAGAGAATGAAGPMAKLKIWPQEDMLRLVGLLQVSGLGAVVASCTAMSRQLQAPAQASGRREDSAQYLQMVQAQQVLLSLESALSEAAGVTTPSASSSAEAWRSLQTFECSAMTAHGYCYGPDWEVKPGKLVAKKGTWFKTSTQFSWELSDQQRLYLPTGIVVPILQIGRVTAPTELKRHDWVSQHIRVWVKPQIVKMLEARCGTWFVYYPHFEDQGNVLIAIVDSWMKRTTQMSGELEPFEMIYVPKGLPIHLLGEAVPVEEEWEKFRHQHVHLHRKIVLASPPLTMKQDKYDIFVGQGNDRLVLAGR